MTMANRTKPKSLVGIDKGRIEIPSDIIEPLEVEWEAESTLSSPDTP